MARILTIVYAAGGGHTDMEKRRGFEDDGDRRLWTVKKSHVCSPGFQGTHALRGGTPWERHSGQTDTDIETRLPTIR